ncbi:MAG: 3'-5' exonuclease [Peptostreptococcaceae bacterium]
MINDNTLIIAYNLQFDITFMLKLFKRFDSKYQFKCDVLDVMAVYKDRYSYPHKLCNAIDTYNVDIENTHRAIDDIKATLEVFKKMCIQKNNLHNYINKIGYHYKYGLSGVQLPKVTYVAQYGGCSSIEKKIESDVNK